MEPRAPLSTVAGSYPVRLDGQIDPSVSRFLWLVKWILVIPHLIVLAFLWLATFLLTIVAGFAILFTGRYPRVLFDLKVGIMRWSWRVAYYAYGALARTGIRRSRWPMSRTIRPGSLSTIPSDCRAARCW